MTRILGHPLFILLIASALAGLLLANVLAQSAPDIETSVSPTFSALKIGESQISGDGVLFLISDNSTATFGVQAVIGAGSLAQSIGAYGMSSNNIGIVSEVATTAAQGEGDSYGVYATGKIAGIVASSSSVGTRVSSASGYAVEASGDTMGIFGYGATAGVKATSGSQVSALGYEKDETSYGLYTDGKIVLDGSLISSGTVNVSNDIILPSMDVYGSADINSLSIGAWKSSQTDAVSWDAPSVNFALDVSDPYYFIIGNADSEAFPLSIGKNLTVGQAGISSVSEFELSPGLTVNQSLHSKGKITANQIGAFYIKEGGPTASTATATCNSGDEMVGCTGVVYEGDGALRQAGSAQRGNCTVSATDSSTKVLAYAYCFDPEGTGTSGTLTALPNSDTDSWVDFQDNCPSETNEDQTDNDQDGYGSVCDCNDSSASVYPGTTTSCGTDTGECETGTTTCQSSGNWGSCVGYVGPSPETCDGLDEDCNGITDAYENLTTSSGCDQDGYCAGSYRTCTGNSYGACNKTPKTETCDGYDNNCDNQIDEGEVCWECTPYDTRTCGSTDTGACNKGTETCNSNGNWGSCVGYVGPSPETCDGYDNDCDNQIDEGAVCGECTPSATQTCGSTDTGECNKGTQTCDLSGKWGSCSGEVKPATEICDNKDNDCDTLTDEGCDDDTDSFADTDMSCSNSFKDGNNSTRSCSAYDGDCKDTDSSINPGATETTGDGVDKNCDGKETCYLDNDDDTYRPNSTSIYASNDTDCTDTHEATSSDATGDCDDNNASIYPGKTSTSECDQDGYCAGSSKTCQSNGTWGACSKTPQTNETCNDDIDNDCDGETDEGCSSTSPCPNFSSLPTVAKDNTNQRFSISWDDIWGSNPYSYNYEIYYNGTQETSGSTLSTSLTLPYSGGYSDSKPYTFRVRTFEDMELNCSGNWSSVNFQHCPPPNTPSPLVTISGTTISVSWSAVPGADSYCYLIKQGNTTVKSETCNSGSTSQTYNTSEFTAGTTYTFSVRAKNTSCSSSQYSSYGSEDFAIQATTCATPGTPSVTKSYSTSQKIKFTFNGTNTTDYCFLKTTGVWSCQTADTSSDTSIEFDVADATWGHTWSGSEQSKSFDLSYKLENECGTGTTSTAPESSYYVTPYTIWKYMKDVDGDTYRPEDTFSYRSQSGSYSGYTLYTNSGSAFDCNDNDSSIKPGATETIGDGVDKNCDGKETCYKDTDADSHSINTTTSSSDLNCSKSNGLKSSLSNPVDCSDSNASIYPGATETCNSADDDCDSKKDDGCDDDTDTYADKNMTCSNSSYFYDGNSTQRSCGNYSGDCNDSDDSINPGATDLCGDSIDQNCSGSDTTCRTNPPCATPGSCRARMDLSINCATGVCLDVNIIWHWWFLDVGEFCTGATCTPDIRKTDCGVYCPDGVADNSDILTHNSSPLDNWNGVGENGNYIGDMSPAATAYLMETQWLSYAQIDAMDDSDFEAAMESLAATDPSAYTDLALDLADSLSDTDKANTMVNVGENAGIDMQQVQVQIQM